MLKSLEIVNNHIEEKIKVSNFDKGNINKYLSLLKYEELVTIKADLEILYLITKWKNIFTFQFDIDYLDNEEINEFRNEFTLVYNYIYHHFGYIPKCFNKVGDNQ